MFYSIRAACLIILSLPVIFSLALKNVEWFLAPTNYLWYLCCIRSNPKDKTRMDELT